MKVAFRNRKGKEEKGEFYFYNTAATAPASGPISCNGCDDPMNVLYALLQIIQGKHITLVEPTQTVEDSIWCHAFLEEGFFGVKLNSKKVFVDIYGNEYIDF